MRLQYLVSEVGSGMVAVLLERTEPVNLSVLLAMVGSWMGGEVHERG